MLPANKADTVADRLWIFGLAALLPITAMLLLGFDANWDLKNYHLYNVHAWFTGRMEMDIAPAQQQSWHNPLLDVPLYLIVTSGLSAYWSSAWLTVPYIVAIFFLLRLQRALSPSPPSRVSQSVLAILALTGAATYSTLALSMNDGFVAAAILAGLLLVLDQEQETNQHRSWLWAGIVAGAVMGLKLTAFFYCLGLACSALVGGHWQAKFQRLIQLALGGITGFILTYGYWGWQLLATHRNPFFPYFNNVFHSPDALPLSWADIRFRPDSLWDALLSPVHLLSRSNRFSELTLSDPRLLIGLLALFGLWMIFKRKFPDGSSLRNRIGILLVFFVSSFLLWIGQYGIYRYALTLELLGCLALVLLVQCLPRGRNIALFLAALLVSADTKRQDWGHTKSAAPMAGISSPAIPSDSLVVIASGEPLAYVALGLPLSVPLIGVSNNMMSPELCTRLQVRARRAISRHPGPLWLLSSDEAGAEQGQSVLSRHYGLQPAGDCLPFVSSLGKAHLCRQRRIESFAPDILASCNASR